GEEDGDYFLAMEFLHGLDLEVIVREARGRRATLPLEQALHAVQGILAGLHYAHEKTVNGRPLEIVHRDVCPRNVFVTYDGHVKLLDFGIATAAVRLRETRAGTLKGTPAYMSPEQCLQRPLDRRSDIF